MSNKTKWTAGPWVVTQSTDEVAVAMGTAIDSPYEYTCGHIWMTPDVYWSEADDEDIANAHLIAAAPELYDELVDHLTQTKCGCGHPACKRCESDRQTERVLAKARGESHE